MVLSVLMDFFCLIGTTLLVYLFLIYLVQINLFLCSFVGLAICSFAAKLMDLGLQC